MTEHLLDGMSAERLRELTGAHVTTCRRWLRMKKLPPAIERLLRVLIFGDLAQIDPAWRGWRLIGGEIVSPEGWTFGAGDVLSLPFTRQLALSYQRRLRYATQADFIEQSYVEPDETRMTDQMAEKKRNDDARLSKAAPIPVAVPQRSAGGERKGRLGPSNVRTLPHKEKLLHTAKPQRRKGSAAEIMDAFAETAAPVAKVGA